MANENRIVLEPGGVLSGELSVPGDKSISHRAVMFSAIAEGTSEIFDCLMGDDVKATINAFRAMGVEIDTTNPRHLLVHGKGPGALKVPDMALDLGNSGTSIRLLTGLLAGLRVPVTMRGDASLSRRPMGRVTEPLSAMGARVSTSTEGTPPIVLQQSALLRGIHYELPVASAQVKSAVLLAGLNAQGMTCVFERTATRDHTERLLQAFDANVQRKDRSICVSGGERLRSASVSVPGDISSAAFFLVGAAIVEGSTLRLCNVGVNKTRSGIIEILRLMGAAISLENEREVGAEPVADIVVTGASLSGIDIPSDLIPSAIDEFPALFIAAACASGTTRLSDASELRHKESDRISTMADGLTTLGISVKTKPDGIEIVGNPQGFGGGRINSCGDHRIAMSFSMAALRAKSTIEIDDCAAIATSFPQFLACAKRLGLRAEYR